jgi:riboflavin kinase/FMN adenylyltransferase
VSEPSIHITVLGSGTSAGVPTVGCHCEVCSSADPRDNRLRPSILIRYGDRTVLIDTTPDFRMQALRAHIDRIDAILFTHSHADHILGLDDVRPFNFRMKQAIPIYAMEETLDAIRRVFRYAFDPGPKESSVPRLDLNTLNGTPFDLFGLEFTPVPLMHGKGKVLGFRFGRAAYLTDHSDIPEESKAKLRDLDVLFLDALRHRPHPTHSTVEKSVQTVNELRPRRAFFTHICHDLGHAETESTLPPNVHLAYDGLELEVASARENVRVARTLDEAAGFGPSAVTIGNFDGVHAGHRKLLDLVVAAARETGTKPTALTFDPHPTRVVAPGRAPKLLTTPDQRVSIMAEQGIEQVLILPFTAETARLSPDEFVKNILEDVLDARVVVVGDNFRFGHKQAGDTRVLAELGQKYAFEVRTVPAVKCRGRVVSSSEVRQLIENGDVALAWRLLRSPYGVSGRVVSGHGVGSKQTVPTLNLQTSADVLPKRGVYITRTCDLDSARRWNSITNVGYRPTFGGDDVLSIETFLLEPFEGASPVHIRVDFLRRVRDERKFESPEALKAQILRDVRRAQSYFSHLARLTQSH